MTDHREPHRISDEPDTAAIGTLLGVWAHPDDEAYLSSALMSVVRDAGHVSSLPPPPAARPARTIR